MRFHDCRQKWLRGRQQAPGGLRRAGRRLRLAPISPTLVSGLGAWQAEETPGLVERVAQTVMTTGRSEEHTSELQSLLRSSYAVFCLKKQQQRPTHNPVTARQ